MNLYLRLLMVWLRNLAGDTQHFSHASDSQFRVLDMTDDELFRTGGAIDALPNHAEDLVSRLKGRIPSGYRVGDIIGSSGMAFVLSASRAEGDFERIAAIKVVPGTLGSSEIAQRFRTELQILARLNHPSIATQWQSAISTSYVSPFRNRKHIRHEPLTVIAHWPFLSP